MVHDLQLERATATTLETSAWRTRAAPRPTKSSSIGMPLKGLRRYGIGEEVTCLEQWPGNTSNNSTCFLARLLAARAATNSVAAALRKGTPACE